MGYRLRGVNTPLLHSIDDVATAFNLAYNHLPNPVLLMPTYRIVLTNLNGEIIRIVRENTYPIHMTAENTTGVTVWQHVVPGHALTMQNWFMNFAQDLNQNNFRVYLRPRDGAGAVHERIGGRLTMVENAGGIASAVILTEYFLDPLQLPE